MGKKRLGVALCGSYCTYDKLFNALPRLKEEYELVPVMSEKAAVTDTRFGTAESNRARLESICEREAIVSIAQAEALGPKTPLDALLIAPCTGNTMAKLAHGVTDTSVTMAAKAHLRNGRPLIIAFSTNDGLSGSAANIAALLNKKNVYFVPFTQDDAEHKPCSLQSDFTLLNESVAAALNGRQIQPVIG